MEDTFHLGIKALIRNDKEEVLLLKVNLKKLKGFNEEPYWDIPGGRIEKGQTVDETLRREIEEEIGINVIFNIKPVEMVLSNIRIPVENGDVGLILAVYECEIGKSSQITLSDEHVEFGWFSTEEASRYLGVKYPQEFTSKIKNL